MAVFAANVSQELNTVQFLLIFCFEFVMLKFISHSREIRMLKTSVLYHACCFNCVHCNISEKFLILLWSASCQLFFRTCGTANQTDAPIKFFLARAQPGLVERSRRGQPATAAGWSRDNHCGSTHGQQEEDHLVHFKLVEVHHDASILTRRS